MVIFYLSTFLEYFCYLFVLPVDISPLISLFVCDFELVGSLAIGTLLSRN